MSGAAVEVVAISVTLGTLIVWAFVRGGTR